MCIHWIRYILGHRTRSPSQRKSVQNIHWKDWCWIWNSNTLATWCKDRWKRPWCWERLKVGEEEDNRGWDGWMASPTWWTWVWASSGSWWWTGRPGVLQSMGSQRVRHGWATELRKLSSHSVHEVLTHLDYYCRHSEVSVSWEDTVRGCWKSYIWGRYNGWDTWTACLSVHIVLRMGMLCA